jgi:hypothetical protein
MSSLKRDYAIWQCATPHTRQRIVSNILYELEAFGEVYDTHVYVMEHDIDLD